MKWSRTVVDILHRLEEVKMYLKDNFTARDQTIELLILATVSQEHLLLVGPPGTAKTQLINHYTRQLALKEFNYLLTRFTEPSEIFGPLDIKQFDDGVYHIITTSMLPEAQIAFLDEVFQGSSAILNALLTILNERVFFNGTKEIDVPLISLIGATNLIPQDPALQAFADRFVLRAEIDWVSNDDLEKLLNTGWNLESDLIENAERRRQNLKPYQASAPIAADEILELHSLIREVDTHEIRPVYNEVIREIRASGVEISDRRIVKGLKLIACAALLRKADRAESRDLWPIKHMWNRRDDFDALQDIVNTHIDSGEDLHNLRRDKDEIEDDLLVLEGILDRITNNGQTRTQTTIVRHLMELNQIRIEIKQDHIHDTELLQRVEIAIQQTISFLGGNIA